MMDMLMNQHGVNWNDMPTFFKRGVFVRRQQVNRGFTAAEIEKLPPHHPAKRTPTFKVVRHEVGEFDMPPFTKVTNRAEVIFDGAHPETLGVE